jgi:hypothetical protein
MNPDINTNPLFNSESEMSQSYQKINFEQKKVPVDIFHYFSLSKFRQSNKVFTKCKYLYSKLILIYMCMIINCILGGNKIVKYETQHLQGWRALLIYSGTILSNGSTW